MAKKTKKSAEKKVAQTAAPVVDTTPTITPKLIVAQHKFNRWYVYFKGVAPKDNVGCGCKTAKSAIRYMHCIYSLKSGPVSHSKMGHPRERTKLIK